MPYFNHNHLDEMTFSTSLQETLLRHTLTGRPTRKPHDFFDECKCDAGGTSSHDYTTKPTPMRTGTSLQGDIPHTVKVDTASQCSLTTSGAMLSGGVLTDVATT